MNNIFDRWIFLFICGIVFINFPVISIFDRPVLVFNIPLLIFYFILGWFISIFIIFLFTSIFK